MKLTNKRRYTAQTYTIGIVPRLEAVPGFVGVLIHPANIELTIGDLNSEKNQGDETGID